MTQSKWVSFTEEELSCPCCGVNNMDDNFMDDIQMLRNKLGVPFVVTSAYRCPNYNESISTTGRDGPHTSGRAIDIQVSGKDAYRLVQEAMPYMTGIGVRQHGAHNRRFIHLDQVDSPIRPWIWSYQ